MIGALRIGWGLVWRNKRLWLTVWLVHLAGASALTWSFAGVWDELLGNRVAAEELGGPGTANLLVELSAHHGDVLGRLFGDAGLGAVVGGRVGGMALLYVWLGAVLAGGVLGRLTRTFPSDAASSPEGDGAPPPLEPPGDPSGSFIAGFLSDCGLYLGRFSRLLVVQIVAAAVALPSTVFVAGLVVAPLVGPLAGQRTASRAALAVLALLSAVWVLLALVADYAKVRIVQERRASAVLAWWAGMRWAIPRLPVTLGLHLGFVSVGMAVTAAYWWLAPSPTSPSTLTFVVAVVVQQTYLLARGGLRVWWYASELALWRGR